jgi:hypothetical protein
MTLRGRKTGRGVTGAVQKSCAHLWLIDFQTGLEAARLDRLVSELSQFRRHTALRSTFDSRPLDEIAPSRIPKAALDDRRFSKELLDHSGAYH